MRTFGTVFFLLIATVSLQAFTLADRMLQAQTGDFVVMQQNKHYSLLLLREKNIERIVFEEISVACNQIHLPGMNWHDWIQLGAPGHNSWIQYEINPNTWSLIECYSCTKKSWVYIEESDHFFAQILSLPLQQIPEKERKKIGPAPCADEIDRRPNWSPSCVIHNQKQKIPCHAWKTVWPKDDSLLSLCHITLYFPDITITPFPMWIEAYNGHITASVRTIHFGHNLSSPIPYCVPKRPPHILHVSSKGENQKQIQLFSPPYYTTFFVYVFDITKPAQKIGPIPFTQEKPASKNTCLLHISHKDLVSFLENKHRYKWIIETPLPHVSSVESEDFFLWNH